VRPEPEFGVNSSKPSKSQYWCLDCGKAYFKSIPKTDAFLKRRRQIIKAWKIRNKIAADAHQKVYWAKERGEIVKPARCQCCNGKKDIQAHHKDYSRPLDVQWLCRSCHKKNHRKFNALTPNNKFE